MSVNSKMTTIADLIRGLRNVSGTMGLDAMAGHLQDEQAGLASALAALAEKGVEVPAGTKVDGLAALIAAIEAGGGGSSPFTVGGTFIPSESQSNTTKYIIETGCKVVNDYSGYVNDNSVFVLWHNSTKNVNSSYIFLCRKANAQTYNYSYGIRPDGSPYATTNNASMMAEIIWSNTEKVKISVSGNTTANFTYGLVSGEEYCWGWIFNGEVSG